MLKVGRNDLCPCGSGKKHKKCCDKKAVVSINKVINEEIVELQRNIVAFALTNYEDEITEFLDDRLENVYIPDEMMEVFEFMMINWCLFTLPVKQDKKVIDLYIDGNLSSIKRQKAKDILQSWREGTPSITRVVSSENQTIVVQDILTNELITVNILEENRMVEQDSIVAGILIPFADKAAFFTLFIDFPSDMADSIERSIIQKYEENDGVNPSRYIQNFFPEILDMAMFGDSAELDVDRFEWVSNDHAEVAVLFQRAMQDERYDDVVGFLGIVLWYKYCEQRNPRIRNKMIYVAALHCLVERIMPLMEPASLKEIAEGYGVNANTVSSRCREMERVLEKDLDELMSEMFTEDVFPGDELDEEENPFIQSRFLMERELRRMEQEMEGLEFESIDEINQFMNERMNHPSVSTKPPSMQEKAQELVFDAYETTGKKRKKLAKEALKFDPDNSDAYNILGEEASTFEEALHYYHEGMVRGEKALGKRFFQENKGHFWMMVHTRPFMRSKFQYAQLRYDNSDYDEAIKHFEELLELNPNDNQGVRYPLLSVYIAAGQTKEALNLLETYGEDTTAYYVYSKLLLELLDEGPTTKAKNLFMQAIEQNPYVMDYLLRKKRIPKSMPHAYGLGDENEAIIYAADNAHFWWKHKTLLDWLKKQL
ncbi:tetratricopeptide repeat protein [Priestia abyssalis]|uniref:tetratricopeptide repeat protein n=1 Tax=Priestia abyssalis TaxID=1221450 RepID=UPI001474AA84|nr:tetratricopeptide repeat protein [Priestia abyssalis]